MENTEKRLTLEELEANLSLIAQSPKDCGTLALIVGAPVRTNGMPSLKAILIYVLVLWATHGFLEKTPALRMDPPIPRHR